MSDVFADGVFEHTFTQRTVLASLPDYALEFFFFNAVSARVRRVIKANGDLFDRVRPRIRFGDTGVVYRAALCSVIELMLDYSPWPREVIERAIRQMVEVFLRESHHKMAVDRCTIYRNGDEFASFEAASDVITAHNLVSFKVWITQRYTGHEKSAELWLKFPCYDRCCYLQPTPQ